LITANNGAGVRGRPKEFLFYDVKDRGRMERRLAKATGRMIRTPPLPPGRLPWPADPAHNAEAEGAFHLGTSI
jgi:hypothetical protein